MVKFSSSSQQEAEDGRKMYKGDDRKGGGGGSNSKGNGCEDSVYNDAKLSRTQPWRLRYPTPHDLKEQLSRENLASDGSHDGAA